MLINTIKFIVRNIEDEIIDLNSFKFKRTLIELPNNVFINAYIYVKCLDDINIGKYYLSDKAYVTSIGKCFEDKEVCFRIDGLEEITEEDFNLEKDSNVRLNGLIKRMKPENFKYKGPMSTPYMFTSIFPKNEEGKDFPILLIGYNRAAQELSKVNSYTFLDVDGVISRKDPNRPCFIYVKNLVIRKEVLK